MGPLRIVLFAVLLGAAPAMAKEAALWKQVDRLIDEQKLQAAVDLLDGEIKRAKAAGDEADWLRALLKDTQARVALGGYETAVRFLKEQPWPKDPLRHALCDLYYANSLVRYFQGYSWEINQREKTGSSETLDAKDLKTWTRDEIFAEANRAFAEVFALRNTLGQKPLSTWGAEYFTPNTYPAGIRSTLRDAVTYLWLGLLADTSGWRPEDSNGTWQLDFDALLRGDPRPPGPAQPSEKQAPNAHPVLRAVAILDDLEAWHASRGETEAALEAQLARLRLLHVNFTNAAQTSAIEKTLSERLTRDRSLAWWSAGAAQLAELYEADSAPDSLVRARAMAKAGLEAHPDSVGGLRCRSLIARIEAPQFSLASMESDGPDRRSVEVTHKNLGPLFFRAYATNLREQLTTWGDHGHSGYWGNPQQYLTDRDQISKLLRDHPPVASWRVDLPETPDFKDHRTFITPPLTKAGAYILVASAQADFKEGPTPAVATELLVSDLVLTSRVDPSDGALLVEAESGTDDKPLWPTKLSLYRFDWQHPPALVETRWATLGGQVRFAPMKGSDMYFLVGEKGADVAHLQNLWFGEPQRARHTADALIFTDRSIYRPQQKILWKVLAYEGAAGKADWALMPKSELTVRLKDANGQLVDSKKVKTDDFGAAAGEFTVPAGRLLGTWRLTTTRGGDAQVRIEEYKRPTFEVKLKDPEAALRLNRPATLTGEARYYFGLPVASGGVKWKITRETIYPGWWAWWFGFGQSAGAAQVVASGTAKLDEAGRFDFTFTPAAPADDDSSITYSYRAEVDVIDEGGETRSQSRSFRLGRVSVEANLSTDSGFLTADKPGELQATRTDLDGTPRAGEASYRILALVQPSAPVLPADESLRSAPSAAAAVHTPGDALRPRWSRDYDPAATLRGWTDGAELAHGALQHDAKGLAQIPVPPLPAGPYRIRYTTQDAFGATFETQTELVVASNQTPLAVPAMLVAEHTTVNVGERARFLVASGLHGQQLTFEIFRAGKLVDRRTLTAGQDGSLLELPIGEKDRGGFSVSLRLLRDHQWMELTQNVFVPWDDKELTLEFATFRDKLRPGTNETWRLTVHQPGGAAVSAGAAQVLAYMYDRSLDFFGPHVPPNPLSLWPNFEQASLATPSLGESQASTIIDGNLRLPSYQWPSGDALAFEDSYGIGGMGRGGRGGAYHRGFAAMASAPAPSMAMDRSAPAAPPEQGEATKKRAEGAVAKPAGPPPPAEKAEKPEPVADAPAPLRTNFSETAFFQPQLLTDATGAVSIEFKVPDSVTGWNVWVHALTKDFRTGSLHRETQSTKDLMVRPYLPRFLREGDQASLKVVVNDASDHDLTGNLTLEIFDPETNQSLLADFGLTPDQATRPFSVKKGGGVDLTFPLVAPKRVGLAAVKVVGTAGTETDGEQRPLPLLPSRLHLAQSRFVSLKDNERRTLTFDDLAKSNDPTRVSEQLVVTVDAQLFLGVLNALPYLIDYPYECSEQTLNRFVTTGILTSLFKSYPGVASMAKQMSTRNTQLETWSQADPNRKMALEETPWVQEANGGNDDAEKLQKVLDPRIAAAQREESLAKLRKSQLATGAFPWWPGGPPSPYMTLYVAYGFSKAAEFGVEVPKDMVQRAFGYLAAVEKDYWAERLTHTDNWEFLTFFNYVCTNFPDDSWLNGAITADERQQMLGYSFAHWKQHSPYLKGLLALTLKRMGRPADATLVFDSVMDSSKTVKDEGTFWAPEDRSWLWYNDTIETQAFALRTLLELKPSDPRKDGLILWLFLNKKLNHWKSTRATAEVLYSLAKALTAEHALGVREEATVTIGKLSSDLVFEPDQFAPKRQIVVQGPEVTAADANIVVQKTGKGFAFASATWQYATDELPAEGGERGDFFHVTRHFFRRELDGGQMVLKPVLEGAAIKVGDELEVQVSLRSKHQAEYVHLRDPRGAGFEPVAQVSQFKWDLGIGWYEEVRDSGENFFFETLPVGEYTFKYRVRANMAGTFRVGPATVQSMYAPEFNAFSSGAVLKVAPADR